MKHLKNKYPKQIKKYTTEGILEALKQAPLEVQDMYLSIGKFQRTNSTGGAFYSPTDKRYICP